MSHFSIDQQRPTMRRKSSAQNLLSSFKSPTSNSTPGGIPMPNGSGPTTAGMSFASAGSAATPTTSGGFSKDWDSQSLHSDSIPGSTLGGVGSPPPVQNASVESLRDLMRKRIVTLTYLRNVHEGRSHWFHTIFISRAELEQVFNNNEMKKSTYRFTILGMSLSTLLDINQPSDLLRGLTNIVTEFDQSKEDGDKSKIRSSKRLFRPKSTKRAGGGFAEYSGSYSDSSDASYLMVPHMPYPLDYHQTLLSLLDVLSEVYNKISKILGPSPLYPHSQHMAGPLGPVSPHPGVSYLFSESFTPSQHQYANHNHQSNPNLREPQYTNNNYSNPGESELSGSLWGIANPGAASGTSSTNGMHGSPPTGWSPTMGEMIIKIDTKFKKIIATLLKDLDALARNGIRQELESLDPLLRNLGMNDENNGLGGGRATHEFDGL